MHSLDRLLTPTRLRSTLLPASFAVYLTGFFISATVFLHGKPFVPKTILLSDLASPQENPKGYIALLIATVLTALLFLPVASICHRCSRRSLIRGVATTAFSAGSAAALLIASLAPVTGTSSTLHIQLAYGAFSGILLGTTLHLIAIRAHYTIIAVQIAVLLFLVWEYFGPDLLTGTHLYNSLAFCEWLLCLDCALSLWVLATYLERRVAPAEGSTAL
jgi:hypothetical protein